jgi:hypothetical protein
MTGLAPRRASTLPDPEQNEPLDEAAYRHQWALLKSLHCARPVLHRGRSQFISCLTINRSGGQIEMLVYLAGVRDGIDSAAIQIKQAPIEGSEA